MAGRCPAFRRGARCAVAVAALVALDLGAAAAAVAGTAGAATTAAAPGWPMALHDARHSGVAPVDGPTDGHVLWKRDLGSAVTPGPVVAANGTIYVATDAGVLHAINPANGSDLWTLQAPSGGGGSDLSVSPLILSSGSVLWPAPGGVLVEVSPSGHLQWSNAVLRFAHLAGPRRVEGLRGHGQRAGGGTRRRRWDPRGRLDALGRPRLLRQPRGRPRRRHRHHRRRPRGRPRRPWGLGLFALVPGLPWGGGGIAPRSPPTGPSWSVPTRPTNTGSPPVAASSGASAGTR